MSLDEVVLQAGNGRAIGQIAELTGVHESDVGAALQTVLPEFVHLLERNTLSRGGLADVVGQLGQGEYQAYLDGSRPLNHDDARQSGNALLQIITGSRHRSRMLAARASRESGVPAGKIEQMLPYFAAMTMGGVARETQTRFGDIFSRLPDIAGSSARLPKQSTGYAPAETSANDGALPQQSPLPLPGEAPGGNWSGGDDPHDTTRGRTPYDDLSDILRRRGGGQGPMQTNPLWSIVRQILGSVLGFRSGGVVGWIIRLLLFRYGWRILKFIFGRVLFGR